MDVIRLIANNKLHEYNDIDLSWVDQNNKNLVHYAIIYDSVDSLRYLINKGVSINHLDNYLETPLFEAVKRNRFELTKILIANYAKVNHNNKQNEIALHYAAKVGNLLMIQLLIESGSYTNILTKEGLYPTHFAIKAGNKEALVYLMKISKQSWYQEDVCNNTLLHHAAMTTNESIIMFLLSKEINPNLLNDQYETPLFFAIKHGTIETVKLLVSQGAYLGIKNRNNETIFDLLKSYDKKEVLQDLLEYAMKPSHEMLEKEDNIFISVLNRDVLRVKRLVMVKNKKDRFQKTALDYAKKYKFMSLIEILK